MLNIFRNKLSNNYQTYVGGESFEKQEDNTINNITNFNQVREITREQRELSLLKSEIEELEQELQVKSKYKEQEQRVKEIKKELKEKELKLSRVTKSSTSVELEKLSTLQLLKNLFSFKS